MKVQRSTAHKSAAQRSAIQCSAAQRSAVNQRNVAQHREAQHNYEVKLNNTTGAVQSAQSSAMAQSVKK
jgi:hypothetical protein